MRELETSSIVIIRRLFGGADEHRTVERLLSSTTTWIKYTPDIFGVFTPLLIKLNMESTRIVESWASNTHKKKAKYIDFVAWNREEHEVMRKSTILLRAGLARLEDRGYHVSLCCRRERGKLVIESWSEILVTSLKVNANIITRLVFYFVKSSSSSLDPKPRQHTILWADGKQINIIVDQGQRHLDDSNVVFD